MAVLAVAAVEARPSGEGEAEATFRRSERNKSGANVYPPPLPSPLHPTHSFDKNNSNLLVEAVQAKYEVEAGVGDEEETEEVALDRKKRSSLRYNAIINSYKGRTPNPNSLDGRLNREHEGEQSPQSGRRRSRMTSVYSKPKEMRARRR